MTIDANELARLRAIADAATPGPWTLSEPQGNWITPHICNTYTSQRADATHIATFDPRTVLALLTEVERLREVRGENPLGEMLRFQEIERQRDRALAKIARVKALMALGTDGTPLVYIADLRAALAEGGAS